MVHIESITDLGFAKRVAQHLALENEVLARHNRKLIEQIAKSAGTDQAQVLLAELQLSQERIEKLQRQIFAAKSERRSDTPEAEQPPAVEPAPRTGHGPTKQPRLPVREVVHVLPAHEATCGRCGHERSAIPGQAETSEEVSLVRRQLEVVRHVRTKYLCACDERPVTTAPMPPRLIPGGRYSTDFAIEVACDKYLNHLPLDRQRKMLQRDGLEITTQALWDQVEAIAGVLKPAHDALGDWILGKPLIHADETRWHLIVSPKSETWQCWGIACEDAVCYRIVDSRSAEAGRLLLDGYQGVVMVDGYSAYRTIARGSPGMSLVHCWAHVRRKYVEIENFYPADVKQILSLIRKLYEVEKGLPAWQGLQGEALSGVLDARVLARRAESAPVLQAILDWVAGVRQTKQSGLRKAVEYMTERWAGLTRFIDDGRVPLDNNLIERSLRPIAMGRKNHLGSKSERGIEAAAVLYSLIESAKLAAVEPRAYLRAAVTAALETPFRILLPHQMRG